MSSQPNETHIVDHRGRRRLKSLYALLFTAFLLLPSPLRAEDHGVLLREDFANLDDWKPLLFPSISRHSEYTVVREGDKHYLRAESNDSSSGLIFTKQFDVYRYPNIRWSWKVDDIYSGSQVNQPDRKEGDDYPIRVYVIFKYEPERAGWLERRIYEREKRKHGEYPPDSALNYVWASNASSRRIITNPYSDRSKMIFLEMGAEKRGQWVQESVNILSDYKRAYGESPPHTASLAIMNDSDDTGQSAVSYIGFIEISE